MSESLIADMVGSVRYGFRAAYESNAFHQFQLVDPTKLSSEARARDIKCRLFPSEELEDLDREGAFCPILFRVANADGKDSVVFRDEVDFVSWSEYAVDDGVTVRPRPYFSPWQLLYLNDAFELPKIDVSAEWLLDDERRLKLRDFARDWWTPRLEVWRDLDRKWRDPLLVLIRLSSRYGPSIKGGLLKQSVTLVRDPDTGGYVDPRDLELPVDAQEILNELEITSEHVKKMHERLVLHGLSDDPLEHWHMLFRMAPARQRAKLSGAARRAHDAYDGAEMLRLFYYDVTGELLLNPDELFDVSDKSWKRELFGDWPTLRFTRADLSVELRRLGLHPHQVHIAVEGPTEEIVVRRVLKAATGRPLNEFGVSMHRLHGVDSPLLQHELLRAMKAFSRYIVLIADREGTIGEQVTKLQDDGILSEDSTLLWDTSFEEANFSDEEIIEMIAAFGAEAGATLTLNASTMRSLYKDHRERTGKKRQGLLTYVLAKAEQPEYGSVRVSKTQLAERMADRIFEDMRECGAEATGEKRPIVKMLVAILRVA